MKIILITKGNAAHQDWNEAATFSPSSYYIVERVGVRVCFETQSEKLNRKSLPVSIFFPTWSGLEKKCAELYMFNTLSLQSLFMGSVVQLYQMRFTEQTPYRLRLPFIFAVDTEFVADTPPRPWKTAGFEKGVGEEKSGKLMTHAKGLGYFLFTWLKESISWTGTSKQDTTPNYHLLISSFACCAMWWV